MSYNYFANVYDSLTQNVDYKVRSEYISGFFNQNNINTGTIVDLACGTFSMGAEFTKMGYNVIGVDNSADMLSIAANKTGADNLFLSPMQDYVCNKNVDGVICCLDSINHINSKNDIIQTFKNVFSYLKKGGIFVFDVNTIYKHNFILSDNTFVFDEDDYYLVWDNENIDDKTVRILIDIFVYNGKSYDRYSEEFNETAYSTQEIIQMLNTAGFDNIKYYDDLSYNLPNDKSQRLYFVCKKE